MRRLFLMLVLGGCETFFPLEFDAGATGGDGPAGDGVSAACPPQFDIPGIGSILYRVFDQQTTWSQAEDECERNATNIAHLAVPNSPTELSLLQAELKTRLLGSAWVGVARSRLAPATDMASFLMVTGGVAPINLWLDGEPNNTSMKEYAVTIEGDSGFRDVSFDEIHFAICECDQLKPTELDSDWP